MVETNPYSQIQANDPPSDAPQPNKIARILLDDVSLVLPAVGFPPTPRVAPREQEEFSPLFL
jgi:hypothetical protein